MKTIANRLVVFAVSAFVLGTVAFGQTTKMQAQIPFAFHTPAGTLPAGQYIVTDGYANVSGIVALQNTDSHHSVLTMVAPADTKDSDKPTLTFRCDDGCWLVGMQTPNRRVSFATRRSWRGKEVAVITIPTTSVSAE